MTNNNHYVVDWRYMTVDNFLGHSLNPAVTWEFKSIKQALSRLLTPRKRHAYRFSPASVPVKSPNPRPF